MSQLNDLQNQILKLESEDQERLTEWLLKTTKYKTEQRTLGLPSGIDSTPGVCGGQPRIIRTRIPVWLLEKMRRSGLKEAEILRCYPTLSEEDLVHAWWYVDLHNSEIEQQIRENEEA